MGKKSRDKGAGYEYEVRDQLPGAVKISRMYKTGPDIEWDGYMIEARRRADTYQSLNKIQKHLDDDTDIYATRLDYNATIVVMYLATFRDLTE